MNELILQARQIMDEAIEAVKPAVLIRRKISLQNGLLQVGKYQFNLEDYEKVFIIGAGKASALMAKEMEELLGARLFYGVVSVKYGHATACRKVRVLEAGHPVIDENGLSASQQILQVARDAGPKDLVICLLSGGGSALLEYLPEQFRLADLQKVSTLLLGCGANIEEINAVRKHLSLVKGGQLARTIAPATCLNLIISDVIGDPLDGIASGPTAGDRTTFADAWQVMERYRLTAKVPSPVIQYLQDGLSGKIPDTVKPGEPVFRKVYNIILGNNREAIETTRQAAERLGYSTLVLSSRIQGEAREVARVVAAIIQEILYDGVPVTRPACIIGGGETTVTLSGSGKGGRNQELALATLIALQGMKQEYVVVSCGTDGTDGPTDAAGGMICPAMWKEVASQNLNPEKFLAENNAYPFLERTGGLIKTGPTGTNVMDIMFALIP